MLAVHWKAGERLSRAFGISKVEASLKAKRDLQTRPLDLLKIHFRNFLALLFCKYFAIFKA